MMGDWQKSAIGPAALLAAGLALGCPAVSAQDTEQDTDQSMAASALQQILGGAAPALPAASEDAQGVDDVQDKRRAALKQLFEQVSALGLLDPATLQSLLARLESGQAATNRESDLAELRALVEAADALQPSNDYLRELSSEAQSADDRLAVIQARLQALASAADDLDSDDPFVSAVKAEGAKSGGAVRAAPSERVSRTLVPASIRTRGQIEELVEESAPTPEPAPEPTAPRRPGSIVVIPGDSLSRIARTYYGDESAYRRIAAANGITNPNRINVGQRLVLP